MPDTICPVCGRSDYYQGKPTISSLPISLCCNGTCSPDCARTKATVDALTSLGDLIRALVPPQPPLPANLCDRTPYYV